MHIYHSGKLKSCIFMIVLPYVPEKACFPPLLCGGSCIRSHLSQTLFKERKIGRSGMYWLPYFNLIIYLGKSVKNKFLFTMTAYPGQTQMTLGQLCAALRDSQSWPDVIQPGFEPGTEMTPFALRCSALDRSATREPKSFSLLQSLLGFFWWDWVLTIYFATLNIMVGSRESSVKVIGFKCLRKSCFWTVDKADRARV